MTASTILSSVRTPLAAAVGAVAANVYDHMPEAPFCPFVAVYPSLPYLEPNTIGSSTRVKVNLEVAVGVNLADNSAALDNLETLTMSVLAALPHGYEINPITTNPMEVSGGSRILVAVIPISTQYTQTN